MAHEEAGIFIPAKCEKTGKDFFVESYLAYDNIWVFAYGRASLAGQRQGGGGTVTSSLSSARSGPQLACPYCGQRHCFICGECGKLNCYDGNYSDGREITCSNCGAQLAFSTKRDPSKKFNFSGVSGDGQR